MAIRAARNAPSRFEVNQLRGRHYCLSGDKGDYPPNFRDVNVVKKAYSALLSQDRPDLFAGLLARSFLRA